jgi:pyruvate dehydrogenase (quinone)
VKVVVFNNGALSFVELEMKADGIVNYGTDPDNPDFGEVARASVCMERASNSPETWSRPCEPHSPTLDRRSSAS